MTVRPSTPGSKSFLFVSRDRPCDLRFWGRLCGDFPATTLGASIGYPQLEHIPSCPFGKSENKLGRRPHRRGSTPYVRPTSAGSLAGSNTLQPLPLLAGRSVVPEVLEPGRRQLGVAHRVLDVAVPEISLQRAGIDAPIGQLVPASVSQHMRMNWKVELGRDAELGNHLTEARGCERRASLRGENEW